MSVGRSNLLYTPDVPPTTVTPGSEAELVLRYVTRELAKISVVENGLSKSIRKKLTTTLALSVDVVNGSDSNSGVSSDKPLKTIQAAIDAIATGYDLNGFQAFVFVAPGSYPENLQVKTYLGGNMHFGYEQVVIEATDPTPANTKINPPSGQAIFVQDNSDFPWTFKGFRLESPGNSVVLVEADSGGLVALDGCEFGATTNFACLSIYQSRIVFINRDFSIVGGCSVFMSTSNMGQFLIQPGHTVTLVGTPTFTFFFAQATALSEQTWTSTTFVGGATGARFDVESNSIINTGGGKTASTALTTASPTVCTLTGHGLVTGEPVVFPSTGGNIVASTTYWVNVIDANTFHIADTLAHALAGTNFINTSAGLVSPQNANYPDSLLPGNALGIKLTQGLVV